MPELPFDVQFVQPPVAKVELLSISERAEEILGLVTRGYKQVYASEIGAEECADMLEQIQRTKLQTPLEFIQTIWLIKDVSRAFTHQLVRYRIGTQFVQESLRFSDKRIAKVLVVPEVWNSPSHRSLFEEGVMEGFAAYAQLIKDGVEIQTARGSLPHHILTNVFFGCSLKTLIHIYDQRTCCQAQHHEWPGVVEQMRSALPPALQKFITKPWETGAVSCGFGASFDRPCRFQKHFDDNLTALVERRLPGKSHGPKL